VKGQVTVLGNNFASSIAVESQVLPAIQYVMQSSLVKANISNVLSVQYLNINRTTVAPITAPPLPDSTAPISPTSIPTRAPIISTRPVSYVPVTFAPVNALPSIITPITSAVPATVSPTNAPFVTPILSLIPSSVDPMTTSPQLTLNPVHTPTFIPTTQPTTTNKTTTNQPTTIPVIYDSNQSPFSCWQCSLFGIACFVVFLLLISILGFAFIRYKRNRTHPPDGGSADVIVRQDTSNTSSIQKKDNAEDHYEPPSNSLSFSKPNQPYIPAVTPENTKSIKANTIKDDIEMLNIMSTTMGTTIDEGDDDTNNENTKDDSGQFSGLNESKASGQSENKNVLYYEDEIDTEEFFIENDDDDDEQDNEEGSSDEEEDEDDEDEEDEEVTVTYREDEEDEYIVADEDGEGNDDEEEIFEEVSYFEESQYEVNEAQAKWATQNHPFDDHSFA
jgi:hypothetical protein